VNLTTITALVAGKKEFTLATLAIIGYFYLFILGIQPTLLILLVPIPLDRYVLFQIVVIVGSLWFLKRAITDDHRLDTFEGLMIILLQAYVLTLLIFGTPVGVG
jgi:hypothetical protein